MSKTIQMSLAAIVIAAVAACGGGDTPPSRLAGSSSASMTSVGAARGIVLVTVAQLRADVLAGARERGDAKAIDDLAARGIVFGDAVSTSPMARPALASIMTGTAPDALKVRNDHGDRFPDAPQAVASRLNAAGWKTAAFLGSPLVAWGSGLERGFTVIDASETVLVGPQREFPPVRAAGDVVTNFETWVGMLGPEDRFFAWIHFDDLRRAENNTDQAAAMAAYEVALRATDAAVGRITEALKGVPGERNGIETVLAGTHGVMLGEDGGRGEAYWLRAETLDVPLVWAGGRAAAARGDATIGARAAWLPDVAVTLLASAGVSPPGGADGRDLLASSDLTAGRSRLAWTWATDDRFGWAPLTAIRESGTWRAVAGSDAHPDIAVRVAVPRAWTLPPEYRKRLESLDVPLGRSGAPVADPPADAAAVVAAVRNLSILAAQDKLGEGVKATASLVTSHSDQLGAWVTHLYYLASMGRRRMMDSANREALGRFPDRPEVLHWVAHGYMVRKQYDKAEAILEAILAMRIQDADVLYDLACARSLAGDGTTAVKRLGEAIEAGFRNWDWMEQDPDLGNARALPEYAALRRSHGR